MMLKKQTVWLLTMLSLIIVLSVYYMTSPVPPSSEMALSNEQTEESGDTEQGSKDDAGKKEDKKGTTETSSISTDQDFTEYAMARKETRSKLMEQYTQVIASPASSMAEIAEAEAKKEQLQQMAANVTMLESLIKAKGYQAALVSAEGQNVTVIVKAEHESAEMANEILELTHEHLGENKNVAVTFQSVK